MGAPPARFQLEKRCASCPRARHVERSGRAGNLARPDAVSDQGVFIVKKILLPFEGLQTLHPLPPVDLQRDSNTPRVIKALVDADAPDAKSVSDEKLRKAREEEKQRRVLQRQIVKNASAGLRAEREANK